LNKRSLEYAQRSKEKFTELAIKGLKNGRLNISQLNKILEGIYECGKLEGICQAEKILAQQ